MVSSKWRMADGKWQVAIRYSLLAIRLCFGLDTQRAQLRDEPLEARFIRR
jgi:hypothetical protein